MVQAPKIWHSLTLQQVFDILACSPLGLASAETKVRLAQYGKNSLPRSQGKKWFTIFFRQFNSFITYLLLAAAAVSFFYSDWWDFSVILLVIILSVIVGFLEENKAESTLNKLLLVLTPQAKVLRQGLTQQILAEEVVPGDVLLLTAGEKVVADARLFKVNSLAVDESILTGEAEPQEKIVKNLSASTVLADRTNMVYLGTTVTAGTAQAIVVHTGLQTEIGKISQLLQKTPEVVTPLAKQINLFSRYLTFSLVCLSILVFIIGLWRGLKFLEIFTIAIAMMVAAIPEVILIVITIILALGMQRILRRNGLVRNLLAAETLGATTVICTDKTGTLTAGQMQVFKVGISQASGLKILTNPTALSATKSGRLLLAASSLVNDAYVINPKSSPAQWRVAGVSTERALFYFALKNKINPLSLRQEQGRLQELPFSANTGWMITAHQQKEDIIYYVKGKPEKVLEACSAVIQGETEVNLTSALRQAWNKVFNNLAQEGLVILGLAYQKVGQAALTTKPKLPTTNYTFLGVVGIKDYLREDVYEAIAEIKQAGIKLVILTGDHSLVARRIANDLNFPVLPKEVLEGGALAALTATELARDVDQYKIYARVLPPDKLKIVQAWQSRGEIVAMTGDGVNDAPALKAADIGVALGSGTEVAKESADLVLLDNNFKTIVNAVKEGRLIFSNIQKTFIYLLVGSFNTVLVILGSLFLGWPLPLLATQILWINLVTDGLPDIALAYESATTDMMRQPPRSPQQRLVSGRSKFFIGVVSLLLGAVSLIVFGLTYYWTQDLTKARTMIFAIMIINSLLVVLSLRSLVKPFWRLPFFSNRVLIYSLIYGFGLLALALYSPILQQAFKTTSLNFTELVTLLAISFSCLLAVETIKYFLVFGGSAQRHLVDS